MPGGRWCDHELAGQLAIGAKWQRQRAGIISDLRIRSARAAPLRDDKILVAWNGLMISAFARAGFAWQQPAWIAAAARAARFVLAELRDDGGRLLRVYQDGQVAGPALGANPYLKVI